AVKSNPKPNKAKLKLSPHLATDPQVRKWTQRLLADPEARPSDLSEEQLAFVVQAVLKQRGEGVDPTAYAKRMLETAPELAAPGFTHREADLELIFGQPEMQAFWQQWSGPVAKKGPTPKYAGAKAVMATLAMGGVSSPIDTVHELVQKNSKL